MTITHTLRPNPNGETNAVTSQYNRDTHSLTRLVKSKLCRVYLTIDPREGDIAHLDRLSRLDDETFCLMANLQLKKKELTS